MLKRFLNGFHLNPGTLESSAPQVTGFSRQAFTVIEIRGGLLPSKKSVVEVIAENMVILC